MTLIAAAIWVRDAGETEGALGRAEKATQAGARLIEWRVDALAEKPKAIDPIRRLVQESPAPCIVTCRPREEGGEFDGDDEHRSRLFESLVKADHPPRYIDLELAALERDEQLRRGLTEAVHESARRRDVHTNLILSAHDFERRPPDLFQKIERMTDESACAVIKVAWQARSLRDNLEAFDLLVERRKPMIALCMGRFGLLSRVLAPKFGGMLTYAADHPQAATAPGQPTINTLADRYRFDRINPQTKVYGVIGWPVEQSMGPVVHNAGFDAAGHNGIYLPLPVPPEWEHFKATAGALIDHERLDFCGASVTSPHKAHLLRFLSERGGTIEPAAAEIGAANTLIVSEDGALECLNTDAPAVLDALCAAMGIEPAALAGKRIAILGAGGVARAAVWSLSRCGANVIIFNRTAARAEALARAFHGRPTT
ncbi:MAG: type I 3-dehydroquinate dehydratase, partial [Planctomycetota bacterium]